VTSSGDQPGGGDASEARTLGRPRLIVGLSGSSAPQLGATFLSVLRALGTVESHLIMTEAARETIRLELGQAPSEVEALADEVYDPRDFTAPVSSGSFMTLGMVVIPCSVRTLAGVATGNSSDLLLRAADVCLKERRRLVLVVRETPLSLVHIRNMEVATLAGATILPPAPAFYHKPRSIEDLLRHTAGKVLDQFGIEHDVFARWTGSDRPVTTDGST
jgi:polyprenyl P-hydroxybenzoate/phenylacrylic acid decarboxylase-like protein